MEHDNLTRQGSSSSACLEDEVDFATDADAAAAACLDASTSAAAADAAICAVVASLSSEAGENRDAEREGGGKGHLFMPPCRRRCLKVGGVVIIDVV